MAMYFVTVPDHQAGSKFLIVAANSKAEVKAILRRNLIAGRSAARILEGPAAEREFTCQYPDCAMLASDDCCT